LEKFKPDSSGDDMHVISVSKFKATCLAVLEGVKRSQKKITITKRGEAIAELSPAKPLSREIPLKNTVMFMGDIKSPVAENDWLVPRDIEITILPFKKSLYYTKGGVTYEDINIGSE
jgi:antitoxin (DNA-binding transcriptional repressor) of toxin-antitoxin stability system